MGMRRAGNAIVGSIPALDMPSACSFPDLSSYSILYYTYYLDQLHVKCEHRRQWRFQVPLDFSHESGQSTTWEMLVKDYV
jgi:hypothetical protein